MTEDQKNKEVYEELTHWKIAGDSPYIGAWDLPGYKPIQLTILKVEKKITTGLKKDVVKNIVHFIEKGYKPMLLNATNSKMLRAITGSPYIEKWGGTKIEIEVKKGVEAFGQVHDVLRITNKRIKATKPKVTKDHPKFEELKEKYRTGTTIEMIRRYYDIDENILKG